MLHLLLHCRRPRGEALDTELHDGSNLLDPLLRLVEYLVQQIDCKQPQQRSLTSPAAVLGVEGGEQLAPKALCKRAPCDVHQKRHAM